MGEMGIEPIIRVLETLVLTNSNYSPEGKHLYYLKIVGNFKSCKESKPSSNFRGVAKIT